MYGKKFKAATVSVLTFLFSALASAQITDDAPQGGISEWLGAGWSFLSEMLMMPTGGAETDWLIWLAGIAFFVVGFTIAVRNFDERLGGWLPNPGGATISKYHWVFGIILTTMFLGTTGIMGWVTDIVWIMIIGFVILLISLFFSVVFGTIGAGSKGVAHFGNYARNSPAGPWANQLGSAIANLRQGGAFDSAWSSYQNINRCDLNEHLCPHQSDGENCWTGCGGTVYNP